MTYSSRNPVRTTLAFVAQTWIAFALAFVLTAAGIVLLPVSVWAKAFVGVGFLFTVAQAFTLAKTVRDEHEARGGTPGASAPPGYGAYRAHEAA